MSNALNYDHTARNVDAHRGASSPLSVPFVNPTTRSLGREVYPAFRSLTVGRFTAPIARDVVLNDGGM